MSHPPTSPGDRDRLLDLLDALLEGELGTDDTAELNAILAHDADARWLYMRYLDLHGSLAWDRASRGEFEAIRELRQRGEIPLVKPRGLSWFRPRDLAAGLLLAVLLGVVALAMMFADTGPRPVAVLESQHDAVWDAGRGIAPVGVGAGVRPGVVHLLSGEATLKFSRGALLSMTGPSELLIQNAENCQLISGRIAAHVPPSAIGFTVHAPDVRVVDLGTDFAIEARPGGRTDLHVFNGEVRAQSTSNNGEARSWTATLTGGHAVRFDAGRVTGELPVNRDRFKLPAPIVPEVRHIEGPVLHDGGFETLDPAGLAEGWGANTRGWHVTTHHPHTGNRCVRLQKSDGPHVPYLGQHIFTGDIGGRVVAVSGFLCNDPANPMLPGQRGDIRVRFMDAHLKLVASEKLARKDLTVFTADTKPGQYLPFAYRTTAPPGTAVVSLSIIFRDAGQSAGALLCDDADVSILPEKLVQPLAHPLNSEKEKK